MSHMTYYFFYGFTLSLQFVYPWQSHKVCSTTAASLLAPILSLRVHHHNSSLVLFYIIFHLIFRKEQLQYNTCHGVKAPANTVFGF